VKFLQIGLGSMGKRRVRCLQALGHKKIVGFDVREDRRQEAERLYGISVVPALDNLDISGFDALVISTPPDLHQKYMELALKHGKPSFVEASVLLDGLEKIAVNARRKKVLIAPSCTMRFHSAIKDIRRIVKEGRYGNFTGFSYHFGNYLPDWHPWEKVSDFYVSNPATGACREIVPFELTWITEIVGFPNDVRAFIGSTMDVGAKIADTYALTLKFDHAIATLLVDVVSRNYIRHLILNMEHGQIMWRWDIPRVNLYDARQRRRIVYEQPEPKAASSYNKNIGESMYIDEVRAFIDAASGRKPFPNTLEDDIRVLKLLDMAEKSR